MDIGLLRPANIPLEIVEFIIVVKMADLDLYIKRPAITSLAIVEFIILVLMLEAELGIKRPFPHPLSIVEQYFMLLEEVDICIIPATVPPINQVAMVYF